MSYQNPPQEDTAIPLVTTLLSPAITTGHGSNSRKTIWSLGIIIVAGVLMLVVAGGVVGRRPEGSSYTTTTAEGRVVETQGCEGCTPCSPATDNFMGMSVTNAVFPRPFAHGTAFQTCYQLKGDEDHYCWSNSWYIERSIFNPMVNGWYECRPVGPGWTALEQRTMRDHTCGESITVATSVGGEPCQDVYQYDGTDIK